MNFSAHELLEATGDNTDARNDQTQHAGGHVIYRSVGEEGKAERGARGDAKHGLARIETHHHKELRGLRKQPGVGAGEEIPSSYSKDMPMGP